MPKRRSNKYEGSYVPPPHVEGLGFTPGDKVRVSGEYGLRFKVWRVTYGPTGAPIVECWEQEKGQNRVYRAFTLDRVRAA